MRRLHGLGFATLCLLSASRWLLDDALPSTLPALEEGCLHYLVIWLASVVFLLLIRKRREQPSADWLQIGAASLLLLGLPAVMSEVAHSAVATSGAALFAMVPLFIVVGLAALNTAVAAQQRALMMPALMGVAGALLILPFQLPPDARAGMFFATIVVAVLLTAAASIWMYSLLQGCWILPAVALASGVNALLLGAATLVQIPARPGVGAVLPELMRCAFELPQIFLVFWLMRETSPARMASRYLLVPLLAIVEGVILLHAAVNGRTVVGMLLMAGGAGVLLFRDVEGSAKPLSFDLG